MKKIVLTAIIIGLFICGVASAGLGGDGKEHNQIPVSVSSFNVPMVGQQQVSCKILWDTTHGDTSSDGFAMYGELVSDLQSKGCTVTTTTAGVDTPGLLSQYNVLVINAGSSANSAYTTPEVNAINTFVNNGGGLLVMDEWLGFHADNLEPVVSQFGTHDIATIGSYDHITNLDTTQPIFSGVSSIELFYIGALSAQSPSTAVAWDGQQAVVNVVTGKKVVIIGDDNVFQTDTTYNFINQFDNRKFASNVFTYLCPKQEIIKGPEFPTIFLPAAMIIGFLGAVLLIQRTRKR